MQISSMSSLSPTAPTAANAAQDGVSSFNSTLQKVMSGEDDARKQAEEAAAGLVSQALILPILKQVRRSPFNLKGPFSAGNGEKTFGPQFDIQISDRIAHSPRLGIKNALADKIMKRGLASVKKGLNVHG